MNGEVGVVCWQALCLNWASWLSGYMQSQMFTGFWTVLYSAPPIPVGIWSFWWNLAESSGVQWNPAEWDWIPVDSTGLQNEIEIKLESGSKYMCTNSCKHKYGI